MKLALVVAMAMMQVMQTITHNGESQRVDKYPMHYELTMPESGRVIAATGKLGADWVTAAEYSDGFIVVYSQAPCVWQDNLGNSGTCVVDRPDYEHCHLAESGKYGPCLPIPKELQ